MVLDTIKNSAKHQRQIGQYLFMQPSIMLSNITIDREEWYTQYKTQVSCMWSAITCVMRAIDGVT